MSNLTDAKRRRFLHSCTIDELGFRRERHADRFLKRPEEMHRLFSRTSPRALVIRDGERKQIAGREVVRGDLVVFAEGDRVPADVVLVQSHDLQTDELLLTGESVPVRKIASSNVAPSRARRPGGDDLPYVFSGSLVVRGSGIGEVIAIGALSEIGKIGQSLSTLDPEPPRLQAQTRRLVRVFAMVGGAVSVLAVLLYGTLRGGWLDAVLAGIALGMSMLPEEFPVVLTVFMAMGAWRISQARVLTRRAAAPQSTYSRTLCIVGSRASNTNVLMRVQFADMSASVQTTSASTLPLIGSKAAAISSARRISNVTTSRPSLVAAARTSPISSTAAG